MIDRFSSRSYYDPHLDPIWAALPPEVRGERLPEKMAGVAAGPVVLVASAGDLRAARDHGRQAVLLNHGVGLSYGGGHFGFSGADDRDGAVLLLNPNWYADRMDEAAHPEIRRAVIGCPKLDAWWGAKVATGTPLVVISFHWSGIEDMPETRWAFPHFRRNLHDLKTALGHRGFRLAAHGHPIAERKLKQFWAHNKVPYISDFEDVMRQASVYVVDNSSTAYEFAALDRPVLMMNAPWYRRDVNFGLRFWDHLPGLAVDDPSALVDFVNVAWTDPPAIRAQRRAAVEQAYPVGRDGTAAHLAAQAIMEVLG